MSYTLHIGDQLQADGELINLLKNKHYKFVMRFLDANYRFIFCTEQSGAAFDSCIDWCAQNSGNLENAKEVLIQLFDKFYCSLPQSAQERFADLAKEIGYDPKGTKSRHLTEAYRDWLAFCTTTLVFWMGRVRAYLADIRLLQRPAREQWALLCQSLKKGVSYMLIEKL